MKFIEEVKNYPKEVKFFHLLFLLGIVLYVVMYLTAEWHTAGYVAYTTAFVGMAAATTGLMKHQTGAWKPAVLDIILFVVIIVVHLSLYPGA
ncbi:MAG: hypothetical protein ACOX7J_09290 [Bacillota bacterium]